MTAQSYSKASPSGTLYRRAILLLSSLMEANPRTLKSLVVEEEEIGRDEKGSVPFSPTASNAASPNLQPGLVTPATTANLPPLSPKLSQQRLFTKRYIHRWKSPLLMLGFFIIGVAMSLAHCIFYPKLKGRIVGNSDSQEEKLRQARFKSLNRLKLLSITPMKRLLTHE